PGDPPWEGGNPVNTTLRESTFRGLKMGSEHDGGRHPFAGTMALVTTWSDTILQTCWAEQDWPYSLRPFWHQLLGQAPFEEIDRAVVASPSANLTVARRPEVTLGMRVTLEPGASSTLPVILTWLFPNRYIQIPEGELRWV